MKIAIILLTVVAVGSSASAKIAGPWHVAGKVSGFAFTIDCNFKPAGEKLGGVCVDASTNDARVKAGRSHVLTAGSAHGAAVTWTYRSSFLLSKFDVTYSGVLTGQTMSGTIDAGGRRGAFSASQP